MASQLGGSTDQIKPIDIAICEVVYSLDPRASDGKIKVQVEQMDVRLQDQARGSNKLKPQKRDQKPDNSLAFRWYHGQCNYLSWLDCLCEELQPPDLFRACKAFWSKHEEARERGKTSAHSIDTFFLEGRHKSLPSGMAIALPYLAVEPIAEILRRQRQRDEQNLPNIGYRTSRTSFVAQKRIDDHPPKTLYEYLYASYQSSAGRHSEQIRLGQALGGTTALVVCQMWLVSVDDKSVVTFFPKTQLNRRSDGSCELIKSITQRLKEPTTADAVCCNAFDLASIIVQEGVICTLSLLDRRREKLGGIRQEYFHALAAFNSQKKNTKNDLAPLDEGKGLLSKVLTASELQSELRSVNEVLDNQCQTISLLRSQIWGSTERKSVDSIGDGVLAETLQICKDLKEDLRKLSEEVGLMKTDLLDMLDLQQKRASLQAAHASVKQTAETIKQTRVSIKVSRLSANQNRVMVVFTIMTVIFLPLSFFASFFSMAMREFSTDKDQPLTLSIFWKISIPVSITVITLAAATAFIRELKELWRRAPFISCMGNNLDKALEADPV